MPYMLDQVIGVMAHAKFALVLLNWIKLRYCIEYIGTSTGYRVI